MRRILVLVAFIASWLTWSPSPGVPAALAQAARPLGAEREAMKRWLVKSDLARELEFVNLRRSSRPDNPDARWLALELRWIGDISEGPSQLSAMADRWIRYAQSKGRSLPATLFYKLLHVSAVPRSEAAVRVLVADQTLLIYYDVLRQQLKVTPTTDRKSRLPFAFGDLNASAGTLLRVVDAPGKVQTILKAYFTKCSHAGRTPLFRNEQTEVDYAGLVVEGIKGCAHKNVRWWEQLEVHAELRPEAQGPEFVAVARGRSRGHSRRSRSIVRANAA